VHAATVITEPHQPAEHDDGVILDVRGLRTHFFLRSGTSRAVDGVDLTVRRRRTLGLVGESGSGKSVTSLSIMRLIKSPPGRIVDGEILFRRGGREPVDLLSLEPGSRAMRQIRGGEIAMIFQEPMTSLNPLYTVERQITEAVRLHQKAGRAEARHRALAMLEKVQIGDPVRRLKEYPHQLSGGMRQRVMIAMALSCNPSLLIADEPTTALDVTVQAQILDLLARLQADLGTGIILITHNLGVIAQTAHDVAVMYLGKIVERAEVNELFGSPRHPYTEGLLSSVPVFGRRRSTLKAIGGKGPENTEEIPGCAFAARCPRRKGICGEKCPPLKDLGRGHEVACWLY
jgi:oligopeptide transport system ATP-binding protein